KERTFFNLLLSPQSQGPSIFWVKAPNLPSSQEKTLQISAKSSEFWKDILKTLFTQASSIELYQKNLPLAQNKLDVGGQKLSIPQNTKLELILKAEQGENDQVHLLGGILCFRDHYPKIERIGKDLSIEGLTLRAQRKNLSIKERKTIRKQHLCQDYKDLSQISDQDLKTLNGSAKGFAIHVSFLHDKPVLSWLAHIARKTWVKPQETTGLWSMAQSLINFSGKEPIKVQTNSDKTQDDSQILDLLGLNNFLEIDLEDLRKKSDKELPQGSISLQTNQEMVLETPQGQLKLPKGSHITIQYILRPNTTHKDQARLELRLHLPKTQKAYEGIFPMGALTAVNGKLSFESLEVQIPFDLSIQNKKIAGLHLTTQEIELSLEKVTTSQVKWDHEDSGLKLELDQVQIAKLSYDPQKKTIHFEKIKVKGQGQQTLEDSKAKRQLKLENFKVQSLDLSLEQKQNGLWTYQVAAQEIKSGVVKLNQDELGSVTLRKATIPQLIWSQDEKFKQISLPQWEGELSVSTKGIEGNFYFEKSEEETLQKIKNDEAKKPQNKDEPINQKPENKPSLYWSQDLTNPESHQLALTSPLLAWELESKNPEAIKMNREDNYIREANLLISSKGIDLSGEIHLQPDMTYTTNLDKKKIQLSHMKAEGLASLKLRKAKKTGEAHRLVINTNPKNSQGLYLYTHLNMGQIQARASSMLRGAEFSLKEQGQLKLEKIQGSHLKVLPKGKKTFLKSLVQKTVGTTDLSSLKEVPQSNENSDSQICGEENFWEEMAKRLPNFPKDTGDTGEFIYIQNYYLDSKGLATAKAKNALMYFYSPLDDSFFRLDIADYPNKGKGFHSKGKLPLSDEGSYLEIAETESSEQRCFDYSQEGFEIYIEEEAPLERQEILTLSKSEKEK
ncbi:MAG: hypothetical protein KDK66_04190, partial [Deltaproteobacteria bacterium]|nr:hypothetical protein [Deltaproteobacteria bacterium]